MNSNLFYDNAVCNIMGILNITPDSFFDGGEYKTVEEAVKRAIKMVEEGAKIVDIGGESTRPGSKEISIEEELNRVIPTIKAIKNRCSANISIDTKKVEVAKKAIEVGAGMVNDVSGLTEPDMVKLVSESGVYVVIMHMQGTPTDMQDKPQYDNVVNEIRNWLNARVENAIKNGIEKEKILIDPGIGFGKTLEHNLEILKRIDEFVGIAGGVMVGASRKSFIEHLSGAKPEERLGGSLSAAVVSALSGVDIIRVHDVKESKQAIDLVNAIR